MDLEALGAQIPMKGWTLSASDCRKRVFEEDFEGSPALQLYGSGILLVRSTRQATAERMAWCFTELLVDADVSQRAELVAK